jgi:hypothetical protein
MRSFSAGSLVQIAKCSGVDPTETTEDLLDTWRTRYLEKFAPEEKMFAHIRRGNRIFISTGCGEPQHLGGGDFLKATARQHRRRCETSNTSADTGSSEHYIECRMKCAIFGG